MMPVSVSGHRHYLFKVLLKKTNTTLYIFEQQEFQYCSHSINISDFFHGIFLDGAMQPINV
jgi:hypothetical protein